ncbi:oligosaccharide flippase family protein [Vibrio splendidus]
MVKKIAYSALSVVFVSSFQMLALFFVSPKATPEQLGLLTLVISFNTFIFLFVDFGISNYLLHKKSLSYSSIEKLRKINIALSLSVFFLSILVSFILYLTKYEMEMINSVWLTGLNAFFLAYGKVDRAKLQSEHRFKDIFKADIISRVLGVITLMILIYLGINVLYSYLASVIFLNIISIITINYIVSKNSFSFGTLKANGLKKFCLPQVGNSIVNFFTQNLDIILIANFSGLKVSGVYGVVKIFVTKPFQLYIPPLLKVYTPIIIESKSNDEGNIYNDLIAKICILSVLVYLPIGIFSDRILSMLFDLRGDDLALSVSVYVIYTYLRAVSLPAGINVVKSGETNKGLYVSLIQVFVLLFVFTIFKPNTILEVSFILLCFQTVMCVLIWKVLVKDLLKISSLRYWLITIVGVIPVLLPFIWINYGM